jgi:hypothetical protein
MPPGQPGRGTPEGMAAASGLPRRTAATWGTYNGITPALGPRYFPLAGHHRLAGPRVKDACGAASGGRATGPVPDPLPGSHEPGASQGKAAVRPYRHAPQTRTDRKTPGQPPLDTGPLLQGWQPNGSIH